MFMFLILFCFLHTTISQKICTTPNGEETFCISIYKCQVFLDALKSGAGQRPSVADFMRNSSCGYKDGPLVCCGSVTDFQEITPATADFRKHRNFHLLPINCGIQEADGKILGDTETQLNEFPWMALLEYTARTENKSENVKRYSCSATLITNQYLLTAAHCVEGRILTIVELPFRVRLGDHDLTTEIDCRKKFEGNQYFELCTADYQEVGIERIIPHPRYKIRNIMKPQGTNPDDIALIRLKKPIKVTENVRPICLPLNGDASLPGERLFAAGWGATEMGRASKVKLKVSLPVVSNQQCNEIYKMVGIADSQLCAGGERGLDTCMGDTGGPVMTPKINSVPPQWYIEGIISFGPKVCGLEGFPGVHTRVTSYINWILDNME